jgi:glycosyltransferase involved in cell wall biosynthesis
MRIVLHDFGGYAFSAELARSLASREHDVLYLYGSAFNTPRGRVSIGAHEPPMLSMGLIDMRESFRGRASIGRLVQERRYGRILGQRIREHRADVVVSGNCPLDAQSHALGSTKAIGAGFVYWWQDRYSDAVERLLARRLGWWAARVIAARFRRLERRLLEESDAIVPVAQDFVAVLSEWKISKDHVSVIPNWAPLAEVSPLSKQNAWSASHGLSDRPVFLYAGTLGRKHNPELLLKVAAAIPDSTVVVVAEGAGISRLRDRGGTMANLVVLPMQPVADLPEVLATADVLVAILDADASTFSIPSKVLTYLTAGRPILASIPRANAAAETVIKARAGIVVDPGDAEQFVAGARTLIGDPSLRDEAGRRGRQYAEHAFGIEAITDRFEAVIRAAGTSRRSRVGAAAGTSGEHA